MSIPSIRQRVQEAIQDYSSPIQSQQVLNPKLQLSALISIAFSLPFSSRLWLPSRFLQREVSNKYRNNRIDFISPCHNLPLPFEAGTLCAVQTIRRLLSVDTSVGAIDVSTVQTKLRGPCYRCNFHSGFDCLCKAYEIGGFGQSISAC